MGSFIPYRDVVAQDKTSPQIEIDPQLIANVLILINKGDNYLGEAIVGELNDLIESHFPSLYGAGFPAQIIEMHSPTEDRSGFPALCDFQSGLEAAGVKYNTSIYLKDAMLIADNRELKFWIGVIYSDERPSLIISNQRDGLVPR